MSLLVKSIPYSTATISKEPAIKSPFFVVKDGVVTDEVVYMTADEENVYNIDVTYASESVMKKISDLSNAPKELAICFIENDNSIKGDTYNITRDPKNWDELGSYSTSYHYSGYHSGELIGDNRMHNLLFYEDYAYHGVSYSRGNNDGLNGDHYNILCVKH